MLTPANMLRYFAIGAAFTTLWLNLHWLAVVFHTAPGSSAWYPARGLSLALLLVFGLRYAPVLFVASLIAGASYHLPDHPWNLIASATLISTTMTAAAWTLRRLGFGHDMRLPDSALLILVAALFTLLTACGIVAINVSSGLVAADRYWNVVFLFFIGDYLGVLLVVPLLVLLASAEAPWKVWRHDRANEAPPLARTLLEALLIAAIGAALLWFGTASMPAASTHARWYFLLLPLALAAIRFGPFGAAIASIALSIAVVVAVREAESPLRLLDVQLLLLAFCTVSLMLGGAVADRRRTLEALAAALRREAERARQEAAHARASKARFLAATTHDLRPPFEAVRLGLETLRLQELPSAARTVLERTDSAAQSLSRVLESVLDTARLEGEFRNVAPRAFALGPLLERIVTETAHNHPVGPAAVRAQATRVWVIGEPLLVERVLRNLITNAIRASVPNGRVLVGTRRGQDTVRVEVHDTGHGIDAAQLPQIFEDFVGDGGGAGIGLSLVREIADQLRLGLEVRSRAGSGTTFSFELPLTARSLPRRRAPSNSIKDRVVAIALGDPARRELLTAVLTDRGAAVVTAAGPEAVRQELLELGCEADLMLIDEAAFYRSRRAEISRRVHRLIVLDSGGGALSDDLTRILPTAG